MKCENENQKNKNGLPKSNQLIIPSSLLRSFTSTLNHFDQGQVLQMSGLKRCVKSPIRVVLLAAFIIITTLLSCSLEAQANISESYVNLIAQAIYKAEGGAKAIKPFGILSVPCEDYTTCQQICRNTVRNNYKRWLNSDRSKTFLEFLANRYAPIDAENDPQGLNHNWLNNVQRILWEGGIS